MHNLSVYPVTPAVTFADRPEWPVYEAPARWYIQRGEGFGAAIQRETWKAPKNKMEE